MSEEKLQQEKTKSYLDLIFPGIDTTNLQSLRKKAVSLPSIKKKVDKGEGSKTPSPNSKEDSTKEVASSEGNLDVLREEITKAIEEAKITDSIERELQDLKDTVQDLEREEKMVSLKQEIREDFLKEISSLQKELEDFKERKVPEKRQFETDGAYKEQLYPIVTHVLDKLLIPVLNIVPDYNLISTQITDVYEDGSIKNGIVTVNMIVPNNDFRYDFRVDVYVLNGLIQAPSHVLRGRKLIPLTEKDLYNEINTYSYRKLDPNYNYKKSPFSNTGENPLRRPDNQKFYEVDNKEPTPSAISEDHKWKAHMERGLI
jgi:hypothetical protein